MQSIWDFSTGSMPAGYDFLEFLSWSSTQYLGEDSVIYDVTYSELYYDYYYNEYYAGGETSFDLNYVDRITYSSGTQQYSFLGTNLEATSTNTGWFDARINGLTFYDSATGQGWVAAFEQTDLILPEIQSLYASGGTFAVAVVLLGGDDLMSGGQGRDLINGFGGDDTLFGNAGADTLNGGAGDDILFGANHADVLNGYLGDDSLLGGRGADTLRGGDGDDTLTGGRGADVVNGGAGNDLLYGEWRDNGERMYGGAGSDTIYGGYNSDNIVLHGGSGQDVLYAGYAYGDKTTRLFGDDGADKLFSDFGNDYLNGGNGNDRLRGNGGSDTLLGEDGNDRLFAGYGDDRLKGGARDDFLKGQAGNDVLFGGTGDDTLSGGAGYDTFVFEENDETALITDFVSGKDSIKLLDMAHLEDEVTYVVAAVDYVGTPPEGAYLEILYMEIGDLTLQFVGTGLSVTESDLIFT